MSGFLKNVVKAMPIWDVVEGVSEGLSDAMGGEEAPQAALTEEAPTPQDSQDSARAKLRSKLKRQKAQSTLLSNNTTGGGSSLLG